MLFSMLAVLVYMASHSSDLLQLLAPNYLGRGNVRSAMILQ